MSGVVFACLYRWLCLCMSSVCVRLFPGGVIHGYVGCEAVSCGGGALSQLCPTLVAFGCKCAPVQSCLRLCGEWPRAVPVCV